MLVDTPILINYFLLNSSNQLDTRGSFKRNLLDREQRKMSNISSKLINPITFDLAMKNEKSKISKNGTHELH